MADRRPDLVEPQSLAPPTQQHDRRTQLLIQTLNSLMGTDFMSSTADSPQGAMEMHWMFITVTRPVDGLSETALTQFFFYKLVYVTTLR